MERDAHLQSLFYLSSTVPSTRVVPLGSLHRSPIERDAHLQSLFYLSSTVPSKRAVPLGSLHRSPIERYSQVRSISGGLSFIRNQKTRLAVVTRSTYDGYLVFSQAVVDFSNVLIGINEKNSGSDY
jgi:hypothetical protein